MSVENAPSSKRSAGVDPLAAIEAGEETAGVAVVGVGVALAGAPAS